VKQLLVAQGMFFEEMGIKYVGPIDGHSIQAVQSAIARAKQFEGPVIIHAVTRKGAGYEHAEVKPDAFHGIGPFSIETGEVNGSGGHISYTEAFSRALVAEAERDERIVAITAAMPSGTGLDRFAERFPDRFFDVGIAEQHAVGFAAGLAIGGRRPVVAIYSTFLQRAYDQLIMDVSLQELPVVFCLDRAGIVGEDGPTHHGVFDLTYLRSVPNLIVMAPANEAELVHMLHTALAAGAPAAIRYPRGAGTGVPWPETPKVLEIGKADVQSRGTDVAFLAFGRMVEVAREASVLLEKDRISCSMVNMRWVKPIDSEAIAWAASNHKLVVTVEENTAAGGAGGAVLEVLSELGLEPPVLRLSVPDCFVTHGGMKQLLTEVGLTADGVRDAVLARMAHLASREVVEDIADEPSTHRRHTR
jgi:1-deoxy-D-xylulose-5-phosphate synthase